MLKKIIIVIVILLAGVFAYMMYQSRTLSPSGETSAEGGGLSVAVTYSRPSVRDRLIFGEKEEGALQPYGYYWRLGANEPTDIDVSGSFIFGDEKINAGKYVIYAIPRKGEMEIRLSSDLRVWGYTEPDYSKDIATTFVRTGPAEHTEQFTITAKPASYGVLLEFNWGNQAWSLPLKKQ